MIFRPEERTMRYHIAVVLCLVWLCGCSPAGKGAGESKAVAVAEAVGPSLVRAEFTLKFDKGQSPTVGVSRPPYRAWRSYGGNYVTEERPLELPGFLVAPDEVVVPDPMIHPRFVKDIAVAFADERVTAEPLAYAKDRSALFLKLSEPLKGTKPLAFDAKGKPPYFAVTYDRNKGVWTVSVTPLSQELYLDERDRRYRQTVIPALIVASDGTGIAVAVKSELPTDDSWKGSPNDWPRHSPAEMSDLLKRIEERALRALPRVRLGFRSPKKQAGGMYAMRYSRDDETTTEQNVVGVLLDDKRVLVLAYLKANVTARLETITVYPADGGEGVPAKFTCSLDDYGALVATLEKPASGPAGRSSDDILDLQDRLLVYASISYMGEQRVAYFGRYRIEDFNVGRKRRIFPSSSNGGEGAFVFDETGALVLLPVMFRDKVGEAGSRGYYRYRGGEAECIPVVHLADELDNPTAYADASNVPLSEEDESRLAWLGVELQPLNRQLARASKVSELTQDGETGALVSYVYPGSPAAESGIQPGFILLRLHVEGEPAPVEVKVEERQMTDFPWSRLSQLPEQYFDRIPQPWASAESGFTRMLTDLGLGLKYTAEFFHDGKTVDKEFTIVESPTHYDAAARCKSEPLGLTVRDLTFEVQRYFHKTSDDPGVIISRILPGSKASIAGLKPFEIITHINDKPVQSVKDFEELTKPGGELRLSVLRMTQTRVVKITVPAPE